MKCFQRNRSVCLWNRWTITSSQNDDARRDKNILMHRKLSGVRLGGLHCGFFFKEESASDNFPPPDFGLIPINHSCWALLRTGSSHLQFLFTWQRSLNGVALLRTEFPQLAFGSRNESSLSYDLRFVEKVGDTLRFCISTIIVITAFSSHQYCEAKNRCRCWIDKKFAFSASCGCDIQWQFLWLFHSRQK